MTFHLGGEEISVVHVDPAHTDGDSFVRFRKANVLHMGDCYLNGSFPVVDCSNGGNFTGPSRRPTPRSACSTRRPHHPGHGPVATGQDLREWRGCSRRSSSA